MAEKPAVLIVEDALVLAETYKAFMEKQGIASTIATTINEGREQLASGNYDVLLIDLGLPDGSGLELLNQLERSQSGEAAIVITADGSINRAVEAMRHGAFDFLVKPFNEDRLNTAVLNGHQATKVRKGHNNTNSEAPPSPLADDWVSRSPAMNSVRKTITSVANSNVPVFITGESGTGKEVCANAIHKAGNRAGKPFIAINCAAIPKDLMESELFGHLKGAFTGATNHRLGAAQAADGGTLFLDEICEMDIGLQSKLLRFLQTGCIKKVGAETDEKVDVRIICATNRNPMAEIAEERFREDLYYRLHVVPIHIPPLRERLEDIDPLLDHFLHIYSREEGKNFDGIEPSSRYQLMRYSWPGNIRELENVVRLIAVMSPGGTITSDHIPPNITADQTRAAATKNTAAMPLFTDTQTVATTSQTEPPAISGNHVRPLWQTEKEAIEMAIQLCDGNITLAARMLEISPSTIYRKKEQWERLDPT